MVLILLQPHVKNIMTLEIVAMEHTKFVQIVAFIVLKFIVNSLKIMGELYSGLISGSKMDSYFPRLKIKGVLKLIVSAITSRTRHQMIKLRYIKLLIGQAILFINRQLLVTHRYFKVLSASNNKHLYCKWSNRLLKLDRSKRSCTYILEW